MTEAEWQQDANVLRLLHVVSRKRKTALKRKLWLFECACCRRVSRWLTDRRSRNAFELVERFEDKPGKAPGLKGAVKAAYKVGAGSGKYWVRNYSADLVAAHAACQLLRYNQDGVGEAALGAACTAISTIDAVANEFSTGDEELTGWKHSIALEWNREGIAERKQLADLFRDVIGNPFHAVKADSHWLHWNDATVPKLAQAIYDGRRFKDMPILADALEEAGCDNDDILRHCREPGEHVRGCWVIDLLLGKS